MADDLRGANGWRNYSGSELKRGLKVSTRRRLGRSPDLVSQRASAEYLIRMHKAKLISDYEIAEFFQDAPEQLEKVKQAMGDIENWNYYRSEKEARASIKKSQADVQRQIRYLKKVLEKQKAFQRHDISKDELSKAYEAVKKKSKRK